jgi:hypothetical protein
MPTVVEGRDYPWYSMVSGHEIEQGDILPNCPMIGPIETAVLDAESVAEIPVLRLTAIIMSQSCDLVVRSTGKPKVEQVILCPVYDKRQADERGFTDQRWEATRKGNLPRYHLLNRCELNNHDCDFRLVDLGNVFSLPFALVNQVAQQCGDRIRLNPPYREHMSQAFARFFMRVGLPVDIPPFV